MSFVDDHNARLSSLPNELRQAYNQVKAAVMRTEEMYDAGQITLEQQKNMFLLITEMLPSSVLDEELRHRGER